MVGSGKGRGRGKRRRSTEEEEGEDMTPQPHPSARQLTSSTIIRTLDDLDTFTSPCTNGSTLIRRVIDNENVYTRKQQLTQTSGRQLIPILGTLDSQDNDLSRSPIDISSSSSSAPGTAEEQKDVETALYLKSGSHKSNSKENENDVFEGALVTGGTEHNTSPHKSNSQGNGNDVFEGALVAGGTEHNTSPPLENSNLPPVYALPWYPAQKNASSNSHEESQHGYPSPTQVHENVGSSCTNNGSKEMASNTPPASSLNTTQIVEALRFGNYFEADSMGPANALVSLKGYDYKVKAEHADLLTSILSKHGDIGSNCTMQSDTFRTIGMELVCDIFQTMKNTKRNGMSKEDLESMVASISDLEKERIDVGWLRKRLDEIVEFKKAIGAFPNLKELHGQQSTKVETLKEKLKEYKRAIVDLQMNVNLAESDLSVAKTEVSQTENSITEMKAKLKYVYKLDSLADGLL